MISNKQSNYTAQGARKKNKIQIIRKTQLNKKKL